MDNDGLEIQADFLTNKTEEPSPCLGDVEIIAFVNEIRAVER